MKALTWIAWGSAAIGIIMMLLGAISVIVGYALFTVEHIINFFTAASTFFLITIALFLFIYRCQCRKE